MGPTSNSLGFFREEFARLIECCGTTQDVVGLLRVELLHRACFSSRPTVEFVAYDELVETCSSSVPPIPQQLMVETYI